MIFLFYLFFINGDGDPYRNHCCWEKVDSKSVAKKRNKNGTTMQWFSTNLASEAKLDLVRFGFRAFFQLYLTREYKHKHPGLKIATKMAAYATFYF